MGRSLMTAGLILFFASAFFYVSSSVPAATPRFFNVSPEIVIVDLNAGQTSFECTGYADDRFFPNHVVTFFATRPPFMSFDVVPGNPGFFRVHAENLTGEHYGTYFVSVVATDGIPGHATSTRFNVGIIPEPGILLIASCVAVFALGRSRPV